MSASGTVKLNLPRLRQLDQAKIRALEKTAEALHTDLVQSQTMPFQTGNLQNEGTFVDDGDSSRGYVAIVSSTPYARRLYFHPEYRFSTAENPDADGDWFGPYQKGGAKEDFAQKAFAALYKREAGI